MKIMKNTSEVKSEKKIIYSVGLIKIIAFFLVVTVHFFLNTEYYDAPLSGAGMFLMTNIRNLAMSCVPLFLIATGYLMSEKKLTKGYYRGILKTLITFLTAEICCFIYDSAVFADRPFFKQIFKIGSCHYAWYIDMYIGLFLIIPFLNTAYHGFSEQSDKKKLVISFTAVTMLIPSAFSIFKLPQGWWCAVYPLAYYFIGCYLREYPVKLKSISGLAAVFFSNMALSVIHFIMFSNCSMQMSFAIATHSSFFVCITSVILFVLILNGEEKFARSKALTAVIPRLSSLVLGAYLISYLVDGIVYDIVSGLNVNENKMFLPIVILSALGSLCLAYFVNLIADGIMHIVKKISKV